MHAEASLVAFLKTVEIFKDLSDEDLRALAERFELRRFNGGETVLKMGEKSNTLFIIQDGFVNVTRGKTSANEDIFISMLGQGDYFGESALFHDMKRTASIVAADKVELLCIDRAEFLEFIKAHPGPSTSILLQMLKLLFVRLDATSAELQFRRKSSVSQADIDTTVGDALDKLIK